MTFSIVSSQGVDMGTYEGATALHAIAAMHRDAGYKADVVDGELVTTCPPEARSEWTSDTVAFQRGFDGLLVVEA